VHSLALAMLLDPSRMHHFSDIGYRHDNLWVCPANAPGGQLPDSQSPSREGTGLKDSWDNEQPGGIGCRCSCPRGPGKRRNTRDYCTVKIKKPGTRARTWFGVGA
jgi:mannosyltransferase